jgi:hypothetical protein
MEIYIEARKEAFTLDDITSAFSATGLIPFNQEEVLSCFTIQLKTPTPPGSQSTNSAPKTPYNLKQLEMQATMRKQLLRNHSQSSSPTKAALNQLVKGCEMAFSGGVLLAQENQNLRTTIDEL